MAEDRQKRNARIYKWQIENMERWTLLFQKGTKDAAMQGAKKAGLSYSQYVQCAINNQLIADGFKPVEKPDSKPPIEDPE